MNEVSVKEESNWNFDHYFYDIFMLLQEYSSMCLYRNYVSVKLNKLVKEILK